eukprot:11154086-Alexandrium_andersonii.AAC.1
MPGLLVKHHLAEQDEFEARQMEHGTKELLELRPIPAFPFPEASAMKNGERWDGLESYCFTMQGTLDEEKLRGKFVCSDKQSVEKI